MAGAAIHGTVVGCCAARFPLTAMMPCMRWSEVATGTDLCNISPASHTIVVRLFGTDGSTADVVSE